MTIENLLREIKAIQEKYRYINENSKDKFNIFSILGMESAEVSTHSAFLHELLNPKGSHNLKSLFLEEFINIFKIESIDINTVSVIKEENLGKISIDGKTGGRIDLHIQSSTGSFIIENKIFAQDQYNQLLRYHNAYPKARIFYLTLFRQEPSEISLGEESFEYECISYQEHILDWLILCLEKSVNHPIVRETINQYINLIKKLTKQSLNLEEGVDISKIIMENDENILLFLYLDSHSYTIKNKLIDRLCEEIKCISADFDAKVDFDDESLTNIYSGFTLKFKGFEEYPFRFEFQKRELIDMIYGFRISDVPISKIDSLKTICKNEIKKTSQAWLAYEYWHDYRWWGNAHFEKLIKGEFNKDLRSKIEMFRKIITQCS